MKISFEQERRLVNAFLLACGVPAEHAETIADVIAHSDFTGVYSHGLSRFPMYVRQYQAGALNARPDIRIVKDGSATIAFDCDHGSGIIGVNTVYDAVKTRAERYGAAVGTGMHAANINCGSYYGWRAAKDNLLAVIMSNTYPCMAPYGGADRLIGTNPIIMACPAGNEYPLVLDISTSTVAMGKITAYGREGKPIPPGWANDSNGVPTTNAAQAYCVLPIAAHKGFGLAVFVDVFGALLADACFGTEIDPVSELKPENTGFAVMLVDIKKFMPLAHFKSRADEYIHMIKDSRKAEGVNEIFLPGEIEFRKKEENMRTGITISDTLCAELLELGRAIGVIPGGVSFEDYLAAL